MHTLAQNVISLRFSERWINSCDPFTVQLFDWSEGASSSFHITRCTRTHSHTHEHSIIMKCVSFPIKCIFMLKRTKRNQSHSYPFSPTCANPNTESQQLQIECATHCLYWPNITCIQLYIYLDYITWWKTMANPEMFPLFVVLFWVWFFFLFCSIHFICAISP